MDGIFFNLSLFCRRGGTTCHCCSTSSDYPLLEYVKATSKQVNVTYNIEDECNDNDDDDLDSDFEFDDYLSPYEQERRYEIMQAIEHRNHALAIGFGQHANDSINHIHQLLRAVDCFVLHVYVPSSMLSARIDQSLELLAETYIGSMFRRTVYHPRLEETLNLVDICVNATSDVLICFRDGHAVAHVDDLHRFGDDVYIDSSSIERYLDTVGVLKKTVDELTLTKVLHSMRYTVSTTTTTTSSVKSSISGSSLSAYVKSSVLSGTTFDDDNENDDVGTDIGSYCGNPSCDRRFPHEHIGSPTNTNSGYGSSGSTASFLLPMSGTAEDNNNDILAKGELMRV